MLKAMFANMQSALDKRTRAEVAADEKRRKQREEAELQQAVHRAKILAMQGGGGYSGPGRPHVLHPFVMRGNMYSSVAGILFYYPEPTLLAPKGMTLHEHSRECAAWEVQQLAAHAALLPTPTPICSMLSTRRATRRCSTFSMAT